MQSLEVINYMDAKEIAGILAMNGYFTTVHKVENYNNTMYVNQTRWEVSYTKEDKNVQHNSTKE